MRKSSLFLLLSVLALAGAAPATPAGPVPPRLVRASRPYDVQSYQLHVRLDPRSGAYQTTTRLRFTVTAPTSILELDAVGLEVRGAWLVGDDGRRAAPLRFAVHDNRADEVLGTLVITLPLRLTPGAEASVEVDTAAAARKGEQNGFFVVQDPDHPRRGPIYLTHFEPLGARRFFPCHDDPADKATFEVAVETDAGLQVLANGRRISDTPRPPRQHEVRYAMARPMSTYLLAVAAGAFDHDTLDDGDVPLDAYLARERKDAADFALRTAHEALQSFQRFLDMPYPFERYGQVEAPLFPSGAMENSSLTFSSRAAMVLPAPDAQLAGLRVAGTVAHELAHQWFGDLVTMKWWDDVWLNESLATYAAGRYLAERYGQDAERLRSYADLLDGYFRTEAGPRSHPIANRELASLEDAFDSITYLKGAQVLRMIEDLLGEARMSAGLGAYLRQHAWRNAGEADFLAALSQAQQAAPPPPHSLAGTVPLPDTPVTEFSRSWLEARGHPVLRVGWKYDAARKRTVITLRQRPSHPGDDTRWIVRLPVVLHRRAAPRFVIAATLPLDRAEASYPIPTAAAPEWVSWNSGGLALVEIEAPEVLERTWALIAQSDPDPVARLQALFYLLRPVLGPDGDLAQMTAPAAEAAAYALQGDPSADLRYHLARRLSRCRGVLRESVGQVVLQMAQAPIGVDPADPLAVLSARAGAVDLLGKVPGAAAGQVLARLVLDPAVPYDLLGPSAQGLARRGDPASLEALSQGERVQRARGFAFASRVLAAYGDLGDPRQLPEMTRVIRQSGDRPSVISEILRELYYNEDLRRSPQLPAALAELVLGDPPLSENHQARALMAMEGLRTPQARAALEAVQKKARSARIRGLAGLFLSRTFN